jgi:alcohol dehydrogenase
MLRFQFHLPTNILFGPGRLDELAKTPHLPAGKKAMIVVGRGGSAIGHGYLGRVQGLLASRGVASVVSDLTRPNPESADVEEAAATAKKLGVDFVLGLGGGSALDSAKAIALLAANDGACWDYVPQGSGRGRTPENPALPIVAVPTTAGSGSEADRYAVISKTGGREKIGFGFDSMFPGLSIVDPKLTLSVPPRVTAATGLDALFHAVETFLSKSRQPVSDMLALEAAHLIAGHLPAAVDDGADETLRTVLAWAATASGMCMTLSRVISLHSLEHALSAFHPDLPHGLGLALLALPYFSLLADRAVEEGSAVILERFGDLAVALGEDDADGLPPEERPGPFLSALAGLIADVGFGEDSLADFGAGADEVEELTDCAFATMGHLFEVTPVTLTPDDVREIYGQALV